MHAIKLLHFFNAQKRMPHATGLQIRSSTKLGKHKFWVHQKNETNSQFLFWWNFQYFISPSILTLYSYLKFLYWGNNNILVHRKVPIYSDFCRFAFNGFCEIKIFEARFCATFVRAGWYPDIRPLTVFNVWRLFFVKTTECAFLVFLVFKVTVTPVLPVLFGVTSTPFLLTIPL